MVTEQASLVFFWFAIVIYLAAFILFLGRFYSKRLTDRTPNYILAIGLAFQTVAIALHWISAGTLIGVTSYEIFSLITWFVVFEAFIIEFWSKVRILGVYVSPLASILLIVAWTQYRTSGYLIKILRSTWVATHMTLVFIAYGAFAVAAGSALFYLQQERQVKKKKPSLLLKYLPSLNTLDLISYRAIVIGFVLFSVAITMGIIWAIKLWTKGWDPYIVGFSFLSWLIYLFYLLVRTNLGWMGKRASYLALLGFASVIVINFVARFLTIVHVYLRR